MTQTNATGAKPPGISRVIRYAGRDTLRTVTLERSCHSCGRVPVTSDGVAVRYSDGVAGYAGLATCGRIWLCPVCNSKVMARRALEVGATIAWATGSTVNARVIWGSLTTWHDRESLLLDLVTVQQHAWRRVINSRPWRDPQHGERVGYVRASELNIGPNGWHPHFHPLIFFRGSHLAAENLAASVVAQWLKGVARAGGQAKDTGAQQLRVLSPSVAFTELGNYVTKQTFEHAATEGLALETVWSQGKSGAHPSKKGRNTRQAGTRTHWAILHDLQVTPYGTREYRELVERWVELEVSMSGARQLVWSRGLREAAGIVSEQSDEELAAEELGTSEDDVCTITLEGWESVRDRPELAAGLLNALESGGWSRLRGMLEAFNIAYTVPVPIS